MINLIEIIKATTCFICGGRGRVSKCCKAKIAGGKCSCCGNRGRHEECALCHGRGAVGPK